MITKRISFDWFLLASFLLWGVACHAQSSSPPKAAVELQVRLSTDNAQVHVGESVTLRFEISNHGKEPFYVSLLDGGLDPFSTLVLTIFREGKRITPDLGPGIADYSPCFDVKSEQFITNMPLNAAKFSKSWMELLPGQFYGREIVIGPAGFPELKIPGKYTVKGTYKAKGFTYLINSPLTCEADEVRKLPYPAWTGQLDTNPVDIEVLPPVKTGQ